MKISSRGQLVDLINKKGVESFPVESNNDKKIVNTIIHCKDNNVFYRVVWGEVKGADKVFYLWYNENAEKVKLNKKNGTWLTNKERKQEVESEREITISDSIEKLTQHNERGNLVFIDGINSKPEDEKGLNNISVVGGMSGAGKTEYALLKTAEAIINKKSVLFLSTEEGKEEVIRRLTRSMSHGSYVRFESSLPSLDLGELESGDFIEIGEAMQLISDSKLIIDDNYLLDENYILSKVKEVADGENGLDLVVIDHLRLSSRSNDNEGLVSIHEKLDELRQKVGCKVIITTQLNRTPFRS